MPRRSQPDYVVGRQPPFQIQPPIEHPSLCACAKCKQLEPEERIKPHTFRLRLRSRFPDDRLMSAIYAREVKTREEAKLRGDSPMPIEDGASPLFRSLAKFYLEENEWRSSSSRDRHESIIDNHLIPYFGDLPAMSFKPINGTRYQKKRIAEHVSPATVNREWTVARRIFNFASTHELIARNPIKPRSVPMLNAGETKKDFFEPDEWRSFLAAFDDEIAWKRYVEGRIERDGLRVVRSRRPESDATKDERARFIETRLFIESLLYTAARIGELAELQWKDIDLRRGLVTVYQEKTKRPKTLPMTDRLKTIVKSLPRGTPESFVFLRNSGAKFYVLEIERAFTLAIDLAEIKGKHLTPHKIRDTVGSWLVIAGFNEQTHVAEILGHKRRTITSRYAHLANRSLAPAMRTLERIAMEGFKAEESESIDRSQTRSQNALSKPEK